MVVLGLLPYWFYAAWWMKDVTDLGFIPAVVLMTVPTAGFVAALAWARDRVPRLPASVAVPALWVGFEFVRGEYYFDGYAWSLPVHPLIDAPFLAASAPVGGVYLTSLLFATLAGAAVDAAAGRRTWAAATAAVAAAAIAACGLLVAAPATGPASIRVAAVQTNVPQSNKLAWNAADELADFAAFLDQTRDAARVRPDLIVWPETMVPGITLEPDALDMIRRRGIVFTPEGGEPLEATYFADALLATQRDLGIAMLVGDEGVVGIDFEDTPEGLRLTRDHRYNSVFLLRDGRVSPRRYDKIFLTPFGETMPYFRAFPGLQQRLLDLGARGMTFDLDAGRDVRVFDIPAAGGVVGVVTPVCFEVTSGRLCRRMVYDRGRRRAGLLVNVTNDGWFGDSDLGRAQHLQVARWRCLELGTPMLRAANTGVSAVIDAAGRVREAAAPRRAAVVHAEIPLPTGRTGYAVVGNTAGWAALAGAAAVIAACARVSWKVRRTRAAPAANSVAR